MSLFPQLGGSVGGDSKRTSRWRTYANTGGSGVEFRAASSQPRKLYLWELAFPAISDTERAALESFFESQNGPYGRFAFCDPDENLLAWTEDFSKTEWTKAGLTITPGQSDPFGGTGASTVAGTGSLAQQIAVGPESNVFTASVWLKASAPAVATLTCNDGGSQVSSQVIQVTTAWARYSVTAQFAAAPGSVTNWLLTLSSATVYVFGPQLSFTLGPGQYVKNEAESGVHLNCRFVEDRISTRLTDFGANQLSVSIKELP